MKYLCILLAFAGMTLPCGAQNIQTLYYDNGQKLMEGRWTYTVGSTVSTHLLQTMLLDEKRLRHESPAEDAAGLDADYLFARQAESGPAIEAFMSMVCDGPLTAYYSTGEKQLEMHFRAGVAAGPLIMYYPNGAVMAKGTLVTGMPDGLWTMYYKDGQPFYTGMYTAYSQAELEAKWSAVYSDLQSPRPGSNEEAKEDVWEDRFGDTSRATADARRAFRTFSKGLSTHAKKTGPFILYGKDGDKQMHIYYDENARSGDWKVWSKSGRPDYILHYDNGRLLAVTDAAGTRRWLQDYVAHWLRTGGNTSTPSKAKTRSIQAGDPNVIPEPGIVEAPPPPRPGASSPPDVFTYVEQMPEFVGDVREYLSKNLRYPQQAKDEGIEGRVVVRFVIRADGSITDASIQRGIGGGCDEEALRVVRAMPKWKPGKMNGKPVDVWFNLPIMFKMQ